MRQNGSPPAVEPGSRVRLRPPEPADADEFIAAMAASRELHEPWAALPTTPDGFAAYVERARGAELEAFLVCRRDDGALLGQVNLSQIFLGPLCSAYLGYNAVAAHTGHGYMTEGVALALRYAFGPLGLHRVEANIQPGNERSRALARRLGFRQEGFSPRYLRVAGAWRDHERWALLADDPAAEALRGRA